MSLRQVPRNVDEIIAWIEEQLRQTDANARIAVVGVTDHGLLTGLGDDDHPQYQKESEKDIAGGYAGLDVTGKVLTGELGTGAPSFANFLRGDRTWAPAGGFAGAGHVIKENGASLPARAGLNFNLGLIATDDAGNNRTNVDADYAGTAQIADIALTEAAGTSPTIPRGDHVHAHPVLGSGDLHTEYVRKALATAKGSIFVATAPGVITELPVGPDGQIVTADSTTATGLKYTPAGSAGYSLVQDEGTPLTARATINFVGDGVTATDTAGVTQVSVPCDLAFAFFT